MIRIFDIYKFTRKTKENFSFFKWNALNLFISHKNVYQDIFKRTMIKKNKK